MPIKTRVTEMLGIEKPIVMGGMTLAGGVDLAIAGTNAGCLGNYAALNSKTIEQLKKDIARIQAETNGKPFAVNLTILPSMNPPDYDLWLQTILDCGVKIVETAGNNPKKYVGMVKAAGAISIHKCVTIRHCLSAEKIGVDIISVDSFECAGHPGEADIGGMVLLAKAAKVLKKPYLASGGIGNGKQLAAALCLGADGVNMGTAFCATKECPWPPSFKKAIVDGQETQTALIFRNLHNTARVFKNKVAAEVERIEKEKGMDLDFSDVAHLVMGERGRKAEAADDADGGIFTAGQVIGLIDKVQTTQEFVDEFMTEAESTLRGRVGSLLTPSNL